VRNGPLTLLSLATATVFSSSARAEVAKVPYRCADGTQVLATFSPPSLETGTVQLVFADSSVVVLQQLPSADGGRYGGKGIAFWIKGRNATLTRGTRQQTCAAR
jgi:membrane-bound inhibitor of C-type lysozyme